MLNERPTGVNAGVGAEAGLLSEALVTDVALIRTHFVDQRMHMFIYNVYNTRSTDQCTLWIYKIELVHTRMNFSVTVEAGLLSEPHVTDVTLVWAHFF